MRDSWPSLFTILALIAMSLCSACVLQPQENKTLVNTGLLQIPDSSAPPSVSLERALQMFGEAEHTGNTSRQEIYYVLGRNLDATGNAESWLFGTRSPDGNELQVYNRNRWTAITLTAMLPSEEILFEGILLPEALIAKNKNEIAGTAGPDRIREIELKNGIYSLTLTNGSTDRILAFDAATGALIAQK